MFSYLIPFLICTASVSAAVPSFSKIAAKGLQVDLTSPNYHEGMLTTENGGIIKGKNFYLQAKKISYISQSKDGKEVSIVEASGDLFLKMHNHIYVGDRIEFDLDSQTGTIYNVMTESGLWFVSGKKMLMKSDGSSVIYDCNVSMSENEQNDWSIQSSEVQLSKNATLRAKNVRFLVLKKPVFWLPTFTKDLNRSAVSPIKYRVDYNRKLGPRLGLSYESEAFENWNDRFLLDLSLKRGLGGGFEVDYKNPEHSVERFSAFNYYAYDIKTIDSDLKNRYRFQGKYTNKYLNDYFDFNATYDKMSDEDFPSDFTNRGFDRGRAGPTQAIFSRNDTNWIASVNAKVRLNDYQTVKQQLPLFSYSTRPMTLGDSGLILDNRFSVGYLDYLYAHNTPDVHNFHSSRADLGQKTYRHFATDTFVFTPYVGYRAIGYGNSPQEESRLLALGTAGFECHSRFKRSLDDVLHIVEPYVQYDYVTEPTVKPPKHYLFDLEDGLYRQNMFRFGARNFVRFAPIDGFRPQLNFDLYARAFVNTPNIPSSIPRVYFDSTWKPTSRLQFTLGSAWHTEANNLDHFNLRSDITVSENVALGLEYRHRDQYAWRKVDPENFMLDTFRKQKELLDSQVSDKRDTFLAHVFWRVTPSVALEAKTRSGWGRRHQKNYNEYELNMYLLVRQAFQVEMKFQRLVEGYRLHFGFTLGQKAPSGNPAFTRIGQGNYDMP